MDSWAGSHAGARVAGPQTTSTAMCITSATRNNAVGEGVNQAAITLARLTLQSTMVRGTVDRPFRTEWSLAWTDS